MAVPITLGTDVQVGTPHELFKIEMRGYTPSADGQRFLVALPSGDAAASQTDVTVVLNWRPDAPSP